tara:strand:- start:104 stop:355 length:252 start_codon:yes stop_codon:yes gene_type:complete
MNLHKAMNPIRIEAEVDDLHWHDLRGTLVSLMAEARCTEIQIAAFTRHSLARSQIGGYLNMGGNLAIEAYKKLDAVFHQSPAN